MIGPEVMLAISLQESPLETIQRLEKTGDWWFEVKADGIRAVVHKDSSRKVRITNRNRRDITQRFPDVVAQVETIPFIGTLDGEIIVINEDKQQDISLALTRNAQSTLSRIRRMARTLPATFMPFDVLELDGTDLRDMAYVDRRKQLAGIIDADKLSRNTQDGMALWHAVQEQGFEGVVAKLGTSTYWGRRHSSWVKIRYTKTISALVGGVVPGKGSRGDIGALEIYLWDPSIKGLSPIGRVGSGMSQRDFQVVQRWLDAHQSPGEPPPPLIVEVEYLDVMPSGQLRNPVFRGFRDDIPPGDCITDTLVA